MFRTKVVEKIKTHILCSVTFFRKSYRLWDNVEKYCRAGQATVDNMAHAHCMLDTLGYKHTLRICSTGCFSHNNNCCTNAPQCHVIRKYIACLVLVVSICSCCIWISFVIVTVLLKHCIKQNVLDTLLRTFLYSIVCCSGVCLHYPPVGS